MAMRYDITGHPFLSEQAAVLSTTELEAQARVAVILLKLDTIAVPDALQAPDQYAQGTDAVALQVSFQVEAGMEAFLFSDFSNGARHFAFRGGKRRMPSVHTVAKKLADSLRTGGTGVF